MINHKKDKNILYIGNKKIYFHYTIDKVLEVNGIFIVLLFEHNIDISKIPLNNVYAVDHEGNIIWQINDLIKDNELYTGIRINELDKLVINSFAGVAHIIDLVNRKVISNIVTK